MNVVSEEVKDKKTGQNVLGKYKADSKPPIENTAITKTGLTESEIIDVKINEITEQIMTKKIILPSMNYELMRTGDPERDKGIKIRTERIRSLVYILMMLEPKELYYHVNGQLAPTKKMLAAVANHLTGYETIINIEDVIEKEDSFIVKVTGRDLYTQNSRDEMVIQPKKARTKEGKEYVVTFPERHAKSKATRNVLEQLLPADVLSLCRRIYDIKLKQYK